MHLKSRQTVFLHGFTLIELMLVVTLIGIIVGISIPSFNKYIAKAKLTEAYMLLGSINTAQKTFFMENGYFHSAQAADGGSIDYRKTATPKLVNGEKMTISSGADYSPLGNIVAENALLNFLFFTAAGKFDETGTALTPHDGPYSLLTDTLVFPWKGNVCTIPTKGVGSLTVEDYGVPSSSRVEYNWYTTVVIGNYSFPGTSNCTALGQAGAHAQGLSSTTSIIRVH